MRCRFAIACLGALLGTSFYCQAAERVCLKTGFCLEGRAQAAGPQRLSVQVGAGSIELAMADVASVEHVADVEPAAENNKVKEAIPPPAVDPRRLVSQAADAQGLDADFVRSVAAAESAWNTGAVSRKGALGLMQLMPGTAKELAVDPALPSENALGGAKYLRALLLRYHGNSALALAAYNAGPGAVERYHGVPPFAETRQYVRRVTREYDRLHAAAAKADGKPASRSVRPAPETGAGRIARSDGGE